MSAPADLPDIIWTYDAKGRRLYGRPNYDKPGMVERVAREAFEAECAANPAGGSLSGLLRAEQNRRFKERLAADAARAKAEEKH